VTPAAVGWRLLAADGVAVVVFMVIVDLSFTLSVSPTGTKTGHSGDI